MVRTRVKLGDVADLTTGFPFKSSEYVEDTNCPRLLRGDNIVQGRIRWDGVKRWPEDKTHDLGQYWLSEGDIALAMDRPWIEAGLKFCAISMEDMPSLLVQRVARLRATEKLHNGFLRYTIGSRSFTDHILAVQTGSVVPHISGKSISEFEFDLPPLPEQRAIASVLSALDDKIELNRRMNATLEAMARALFRDWFVDFGPTRAKMAGHESYLAPEIWPLFPDRLDDNGVPEGWETQSVIDQAEWVNGAAYKNMHFSKEPDALPVIKIAELKAGVTQKTKWTNTALGEKYRIKDRELLFSWSGNPDTSIDTFIWTGGEAWLNQHIFAVRSNGTRTPAFLYTMLKWLKPEFSEIARNKQTTGLGHVTKQDLKRMQIHVGSNDILGEFERLAGPIYARLQSNLTETRTLAQTRDLLLPKLMSGEIHVRAAEAIVEAAG